jgi:F-type H+-transporting ATPase subunit delta
MKDSIVIEGIVAPYAQALLSLGQAQNLTDRFGEDALSLINLLNESEDLRNLLASPVTNPDIKRAVLSQVLGDSVHSYMLNFLMILVERSRIQFLDRICQQYRNLLRELNQTVLAEVTSVVPLSDAQQEEVRQKVLKMTGARQVELSTSIDPELLGGVIIKVGSQVIDASLRDQLRRIGMQLSAPV